MNDVDDKDDGAGQNRVVGQSSYGNSTHLIPEHVLFPLTLILERSDRMVQRCALNCKKLQFLKHKNSLKKYTRHRLLEGEALELRTSTAQKLVR